MPWWSECLLLLVHQKCRRSLHPCNLPAGGPRRKAAAVTNPSGSHWLQRMLEHEVTHTSAAQHGLENKGKIKGAANVFTGPCTLK